MLNTNTAYRYVAVVVFSKVQSAWTVVEAVGLQLHTVYKSLGVSQNTLTVVESTNQSITHTNATVQGVANNATTLWVADSTETAFVAYTTSSRTRDSSEDIDWDGFTEVRGCCEDDGKLYALANAGPGGEWKVISYTLSDKQRSTADDFNLFSDSSFPNTDPQYLIKTRSGFVTTSTHNRLTYFYKYGNDGTYIGYYTHAGSNSSGGYFNGGVVKGLFSDDDEVFAQYSSEYNWVRIPESVAQTYQVIYSNGAVNGKTVFQNIASNLTTNNYGTVSGNNIFIWGGGTTIRYYSKSLLPSRTKIVDALSRTGNILPALTYFSNNDTEIVESDTDQGTATLLHPMQINNVTATSRYADKTVSSGEFFYQPYPGQKILFEILSNGRIKYLLQESATANLYTNACSANTSPEGWEYNSSLGDTLLLYERET